MYAPSKFKRPQHLWKIKGEYLKEKGDVICWRCGESKKEAYYDKSTKTKNNDKV